MSMSTASNTGHGKASMRTPVARARGLGAAKEGVQHWWAQRVSAAALVPLALWFVASIIGLAGADHAAVVEWLSNPLVTVLMIVLIGTTFYHASLGMQVVYEDYIHTHWLLIVVNVGTKFLCVLLAASAILAVLKISLGA
jgi:succinate dehydrogenase / fumarate reductase membrane anchor subunit